MSFFFFFFNDTATTEIYTLSLHDALPIWRGGDDPLASGGPAQRAEGPLSGGQPAARPAGDRAGRAARARSEEHTSELQSHVNLVCRLLLEKKKNNNETRSSTQHRSAHTHN